VPLQATALAGLPAALPGYFSTTCFTATHQIQRDNGKAFGGELNARARPCGPRDPDQSFYKLQVVPLWPVALARPIDVQLSR
jgi:hypothetical protein